MFGLNNKFCITSYCIHKFSVLIMPDQKETYEKSIWELSHGDQARFRLGNFPKNTSMGPGLEEKENTHTIFSPLQYIITFLGKIQVKLMFVLSLSTSVGSTLISNFGVQLQTCREKRSYTCLFFH